MGTTNKSTFENVGSIIPKELRNILIEGFQQLHPSRQGVYYVNKSLIQELLSGNDTSSLRFMYGIKDINNPQVDVVLMPCGYEILNENDVLPNINLYKKGYYLHTGEAIDYEKTWMMFSNFVQFQYKQNPNINLKTLNRGFLFGKETLQIILDKTENGLIKIELGYAMKANQWTTIDYHPVLSSLNTKGESTTFVEISCPCPSDRECCKPSEICLFTESIQTYLGKRESTELNDLRTFRNQIWVSQHGALVEKYYHISPIILTKLKSDINRETKLKDFAQEALKPCLEALKDNHKGENILDFFEHFNDISKPYIL